MWVWVWVSYFLSHTFYRNINACVRVEIHFAQAIVIFEALDNILSESNQASFDNLQEEGVGGSQAVLMNAESFGLYAAQVLAMDQDMGPGQTVNITGENIGIYDTL